MFAVIEIGGKQYKVSEGDIIYTEKIISDEGAEISIESVLALSSGGDFKMGAPTVDGASVKASVVKHGKGKKLSIIRYKPKNNDMKRMGHRQPYTKLQITKISG